MGRERARRVRQRRAVMAAAGSKACVLRSCSLHASTPHPHDVLCLRAGIHALWRVLLQPCGQAGSGGGTGGGELRWRGCSAWVVQAARNGACTLCKAAVMRQAPQSDTSGRRRHCAAPRLTLEVSDEALARGRRHGDGPVPRGALGARGWCGAAPLGTGRLPGAPNQSRRSQIGPRARLGRGKKGPGVPCRQVFMPALGTLLPAVSRRTHIDPKTIALLQRAPALKPPAQPLRRRGAQLCEPAPAAGQWPAPWLLACPANHGERSARGLGGRAALQRSASSTPRLLAPTPQTPATPLPIRCRACLPSQTAPKARLAAPAASPRRRRRLLFGGELPDTAASAGAGSSRWAVLGARAAWMHPATRFVWSLPAPLAPPAALPAR